MSCASWVAGCQKCSFTPSSKPCSTANGARWTGTSIWLEIPATNGSRARAEGILKLLLQNHRPIRITSTGTSKFEEFGNFPNLHQISQNCQLYMAVKTACIRPDLVVELSGSVKKRPENKQQTNLRSFGCCHSRNGKFRLKRRRLKTRPLGRA